MFHQHAFSTEQSQSESLDERNIERSLLIGCRTVYGRGMVTTFAHFDTETLMVLLEERDRERSLITPMAAADAIRLRRFLTDVEGYLLLKRSA